MKKFTKMLVGGMLALGTLSSTAATFVGTRDDFRDETIYFAMTTRFYDGDKSNNVYCWDGVNNVKDPEWRGDFKGLIEKLDYIKALGFTAVWITPVVENASGLDYHGYHAFNFNKVDPRYESQDVKFQNVIDEVHKRGMKLILDIVLQHTGNFGEEKLCPMFVKDYSKNLSNIDKTMKLHPNTMLPSNYFSLQPGEQYNKRLAMMKNTDGQNHDSHNYWHHVGNNWDWDDYSRVWGQIAGDCVDLNTENPAVSNYIVDCYSKFIKMGVDGFRIDTSGHIARLTFNKAFIPQFIEASKSAEAIAKRGNTPFFMFGEVCARGEEVIYHNDNYNCSPCFYTWAETKNYAWDTNPTSWDNYVVMEGQFGDHPNAKSVLQQAQDYRGHSDAILQKSNNAWLNGNDYHTPDYSLSSNFSVIDFPMHWRFYNASNAFGVNSQDNLYNDATYNVVYVDGHDYGPNGWDTKSFGGSLNEWAENYSLMFTFRGIPCIFQGSESYFRKGGLIDKGAIEPLKNTSRAYFGGYLTGSVTTTDFAEYTNATGNLAATLSHPLAIHLQRLNKIRAAIPALRKGQYSTSGCSGTMAFKRRYKDSKVDSYVLVTISGNATFSNILNGRYVDVVSGDVKNVTNGTLTATCSGQGNLRVYVLDNDNKYGKIGTDNQFAYASSPVTTTQKAYDGQQEADDTETVRDTEPYDPSQTAKVEFSPNGGAFRTETLTVSASLNSDAVSGWYKVDGGSQVNLTKGATSSFTIGQNMTFGQSVSVSWGATDASGASYTGTVTYKKVDPNATITIYVEAANAPNLYAWNESSTSLNGAWPGNKLSKTTEIDGHKFWHETFDVEIINVIFNMGSDSNKTEDIKGITEDAYFTYDGNTGYKRLTDINPGPSAPTVTANPASGTSFTESITVSLSATGNASIHYTTNGSEPTASSPTYTSPLTFTQTTTLKTYVANENGSKVQTFTYTKREVGAGITIYVQASNAPYLHAWTDSGDLNGNWPGRQMTDKANINGTSYWYQTFDVDKVSIIFNNGNGGQTGNIEGITEDAYFTYDGNTGYTRINDPFNQGQDPTPGKGITVYFDNNNVKYNPVHIYYWSDSNTEMTSWPGTAMKSEGGHIYSYTLPEGAQHVIFNANGNSQTVDVKNVQHNHLYVAITDTEDNKHKVNDNGVYASSIENVTAASDEITVEVMGSDIYVTVSTATMMPIYDLYGRCHVEAMWPGVNVISGLHGVYMINGVKVFVK